jgi:mandelate racemase
VNVTRSTPKPGGHDAFAAFDLQSSTTPGDDPREDRTSTTAQAKRATTELAEPVATVDAELAALRAATGDTSRGPAAAAPWTWRWLRWEEPVLCLYRGRMRVEQVATEAVVVPLARPVRTASGTVDRAPLVLIDLITDDGIVGRAYLFSYYPWALPPLEQLVVALGELIRGEPLVPAALSDTLRRRVKLLGSRNVVGMAISGLDTAAWDALAQSAGLPLVELLGGAAAPIPAYDSLGMFSADDAGDAAAESVQRSFRALKIRLGFPTLQEDLAAVRAARAAIPDDVALMVDYNQSLDPVEAIRRGRALDGEGVAWIEEPIRADDLRNCARVAADVATPIQIGENLNGDLELREAITVGASDLLMPDLQQIGGVSGWLEAAALTHSAGIPMSNHLFVEASAHLLAVTPTGHWLEYLDLAGPVLDEPAQISDGHLVASGRAGLGLVWDTDAVKRYRIT